MKSELFGWVQKGTDIAGAGAAPAAAAFLGDVSGGIITQTVVVFTKEIVEYMGRQNLNVRTKEVQPH